MEASECKDGVLYRDSIKTIRVTSFWCHLFFQRNTIDSNFCISILHGTRQNVLLICKPPHMKWHTVIAQKLAYLAHICSSVLSREPGSVAQLVGHLTGKSEVLGSIPSLATYFCFSFRFFKKGSCQLLAKVCARSTD